jgi:hypothetical protein
LVPPKNCCSNTLYHVSTTNLSVLPMSQLTIIQVVIVI